MIRRTAASLVAVAVLGLSIAGTAHAARFGGRGGGGAPAFHGGGFHGGAFHGGSFHHGGFHSGVRVFVGGAFVAPFAWPYYSPPAYYYPPAYYPDPAYYPPSTEYVAPAQAPAAGYWYYCAGSQAYYPYVRDCPGGWQQVAPQPPQ